LALVLGGRVHLQGTQTHILKEHEGMTSQVSSRNMARNLAT